MPSKPRVFNPHPTRSQRERRADDDARRRSARDRGYDAVWDRAARAHKMRNPLCLGCKAVGRFVAAEVTDHILPVTLRPDLRMVESNWQSACDWHHDVIKRKLERMFKAGEIDEASLRLDSPVAVRLTLAEGEGGSKL